jgi:hypothetical protein
MRQIQQNEYVSPGARGEQMGVNEMNKLMDRLYPGFVPHGLRS